MHVILYNFTFIFQVECPAEKYNHSEGQAKSPTSIKAISII